MPLRICTFRLDPEIVLLIEPAIERGMFDTVFW